MKNTFLLAFILIFTLSCKNENTNTSQEIASKPIEKVKKAIVNPKTTSFEIEGMTCAVGCANLIETKLKKLDGVAEAKVNFDTKTATVTYDAAVLNQEKLTKAVEAVGGGDLYKVSEVKS